jgi:phosphohistidine phosphatase
VGARRVTLVRHGKARDAAPGSRDWDRELTDAGRNEVQRVAEELAQSRTPPASILTSPAPRTLETARILAGALEYPEESIVQDQRLYLAAPDLVLEVLRDHAGGDPVAIVGHNPGLSEFARRVSGDASLAELPTAGTITIDVEI